MSYVLEAHLKHDFSKIAARYLASAAPDLTDVLGKGASRRKAAGLSVEESAAMFCSVAAQLHSAAAVMSAKLAADHGLFHIYKDLELPVMRVLQKMERTGFSSMATSSPTKARNWVSGSTPCARTSTRSWANRLIPAAPSSWLTSSLKSKGCR